MVHCISITIATEMNHHAEDAIDKQLGDKSDNILFHIHSRNLEEVGLDVTLLCACGTTGCGGGRAACGGATGTGGLAWPPLSGLAGCEGGGVTIGGVGSFLMVNGLTFDSFELGLALNSITKILLVLNWQSNGAFISYIWCISEKSEWWVEMDCYITI